MWVIPVKKFLKILFLMTFSSGLYACFEELSTDTYLIKIKTFILFFVFALQIIINFLCMLLKLINCKNIK